VITNGRHLQFSCGVISDVGAGDAADLVAKMFAQNWLDLGKFGWIWAKLRQNLGKND